MHLPTPPPLARRALLLAAAAVPLAAPRVARALPRLRVGDQRGNARAVMEASGQLAGFGDRLEWSEFPAAAPLMEAMNANAIDTGLVGDAPFTFAAAAGVPAKAITATRQNQDGLAIVVTKDSPAHTLADLRGKRIATGRGSIGHQLVLAALRAASMPTDAVRIVFLQPADCAAALASGSVDAWSTWEPYVAQQEVIAGARRVADGRGITPGLSFQAARTEAIAARHEELGELVRRLSLARAWANTHVSDYAHTWSHMMNVPEPVAQLWFSRAQTRVVPIDDRVVADEQGTIDLYAAAGLMAGHVTAEAILDRSFNASVPGTAGAPG